MRGGGLEEPAPAARGRVCECLRAKEAPTLGPQSLRRGLKGAVISHAVRSVGASSPSQSRAEALGLTRASRGFPGALARAQVQTSLERRVALWH